MLTRRDTIALGACTVAASLISLPALAATVDEAIAAFTGGAAVAEGGVTITAPEIAENGNTVPVTIEAPGAVEIVLLAAGNPAADVAKFTFGPASGSAMAATRIRLGRTQDIIAIAKMADGSFTSARVEVKVTIGGCGG